MAYANEETIKHLKQWEGLRLEAYPDPGSRDGHPWTIGYGHTSDDHLQVTPGLKITESRADAALRHDANEAGETVNSLVKVPLTDNQRGALISFVFNVGAAAFKKSTLLKRLNRGEYDAVPAELAKWKYNDGKVMKGLINRRAAEAGLWAKGEFVASQHVQPSTAPTASVALKPEVITAAGGVLAAAGGVVSGDGPVQLAIAVAIGVVVLVGAFIVMRRQFKS